MFSSFVPQNAATFEQKILEIADFEIIPTDDVIDFLHLNLPEPEEEKEKPKNERRLNENSGIDFTEFYDQAKSLGMEYLTAIVFLLQVPILLCLYQVKSINSKI